MSSTRSAIGAARRIVVKVGSSSLTSLTGGLDPARLDGLVDALMARRHAGSQVVLVSSGAIAAGLAPLQLRRRPRDLATQQAAASVGQLLLAHAYSASFARHGQGIGQVLLTADDMIRRASYRNAQRTLERLLQLGSLPVVNENDTVATAEIRVGDNDRLAALVAHIVGADALLLLSDVDGLYDGDPRDPGSSLVTEVDDPAELAGISVTRTGSGLGTGGMSTKVTAAAMASAAGIPVLLTSAEEAAAAVDAVPDGPKVGTAFRASGRRMSARRFWLRHAADVRGALDLDDGAVEAVRTRRRSLLAAGVHGVSGDFVAGDVVELLAPHGRPIARGVVSYDAAELPAMIGRRSRELPPEQRRELVHADDLVLVQ
ncbi:MULTISPECIES: glutamate 5-kinase [Pseudonocardia]|uniref:Glutamate 5-kinase n=2 Tax=Pseudonocardia TaxID=1847 RepID=A0A1Y2MYM9_PSEAH|nr:MULTISPECIES: glutamate 5-kinase [Pseudonocardia]OSY40161.1 Glutamate 5-kinase [Pseudonocardia autotrophica]TDN72894.1 glutamate 5-kinase [Pseudonocardia autotrophica]BBG03613.1 glutamate 5-kinase [Pseudonocardia autotrophica]GEC26311.1 glutamate 5-kinase [Pseudonocardia saturnea]